jgi:uncharacterized protein
MSRLFVQPAEDRAQTGPDDHQARGVASPDYLQSLAKRSIVRLLVFSDSHTHLDFMMVCLEDHPDVDLIIHLGDHGADPSELNWIFNKPWVAIAGNNDSLYRARLPERLTLQLAGRCFFLTHGHLEGVKQQLRMLLDTAAAQPEPVETILFGHTHHPLEREIEWLGRHYLLLNPGSAHGTAYAPPSALLVHIDAAGIARQWLD